MVGRRPLTLFSVACFQMGQMVFQRLFYHHMAGQLQGHSDFKNRLFTYTDGQLSFFLPPSDCV